MPNALKTFTMLTESKIQVEFSFSEEHIWMRIFFMFVSTEPLCFSAAFNFPALGGLFSGVQDITPSSVFDCECRFFISWAPGKCDIPVQRAYSFRTVWRNITNELLFLSTYSQQQGGWKRSLKWCKLKPFNSAPQRAVWFLQAVRPLEAHRSKSELKVRKRISKGLLFWARQSLTWRRTKHI